jgi:hypothetical protein
MNSAVCAHNGTARQRWTKRVELLNLVGRHPAKISESLDDRIVQHRMDTRGDRGPDVPMQDGATSGVEKVVHGG